MPDSEDPHVWLTPVKAGEVAGCITGEGGGSCSDCHGRRQAGTWIDNPEGRYIGSDETA